MTCKSPFLNFQPRTFCAFSDFQFQSAVTEVSKYDFKFLLNKQKNILPMIVIVGFGNRKLFLEARQALKQLVN